MDFKSFFYKLAKGAVSGAVGAFVVLGSAGVPITFGKEAVGALISGAIHGISNVVEQKSA